MNFKFPTGILETILLILLVYILGTGFLGYLTNKVLPNLLNRFDEEIIYERIPIFRQKISEDIENTIMILRTN